MNAHTTAPKISEILEDQSKRNVLRPARISGGDDAVAQRAVEHRVPDDRVNANRFKRAA